MKRAKTFTYTFASPNTTYNSVSNLKYRTIFNFVNKDDVVCEIPCANVGSFHRYGRDIPISISDGDSITGGKLADSFSYIMMDDYDGNDPEDISNLIKSIKEEILKGNRAQCYEIDVEHHPEVYDSCVHDKNSTKLSEAQATAKLKEITDELTNKGLINYCKLVIQKMAGETDRYEIIR